MDECRIFMNIPAQNTGAICSKALEHIIIYVSENAYDISTSLDLGQTAPL